MICRLCLNDSIDFIHIFKKFEEDGLNVADIIEKYFWFKPARDDPISTIVCNCCWFKVVDFHQFYISVEEAQRNHQDVFYLNTYNKTRKREDLYCVKEESPLVESNWEVKAVFTDDILSYGSGSDSNILKSEEESKYDDKQSESSSETSNQEASEFSENKTYNKQRESLSDADDSGTDDLLYIKKELFEKENEQEALYQTDPLHVQPKKSELSAQEDEEAMSKHDSYSDEQKLPRCIKSKEADEKIAKHMRLICDVCGIGQATFADIIQHFQLVHSKRGYVKCCDRKWYKRILLIEHIYKHLDPEYFKCLSCKKVYSDKNSLRRHELANHEADDKMIYQCEKCPKKFAKRYLLEKHHRVHIPFEERVICEICEKRFFSHAFLRAHKKKKHSTECDIICDVCAKVLCGKAAFERHQIEHSVVKPPKIQCEKCSSWLKDKQSLKSHMRLHKEEGKQHKCGYCGKISPNKIALRSHIRYLHKTPKIFECTLCTKSFKKQLSLKEHMTTHTGGVLYSCPYCPKTFNSNANMHSHRKKIHPKEWEQNRKHRMGKSMVNAKISVQEEAIPKASHGKIYGEC